MFNSHNQCRYIVGKSVLRLLSFFFLWIISRALETKESFVTQTKLTVADPGEGLRGLLSPRPHPIFRRKWGRKKSQEIFFLRPGAPLSEGLDLPLVEYVAGSHVTWECQCTQMNFQTFLKVQCLSGWRWLSFGSNEQKPSLNQWYFRNQESTVYPPFNFCRT